MEGGGCDGGTVWRVIVECVCVKGESVCVCVFLMLQRTTFSKF